MTWIYLVQIEEYKDLDCLPLSLRLYGASDYATMDAQPGKDPDFTEHGVVGIDHVGDMWFIDWFYEQCETDKGIAEFIRLIKRYKSKQWGGGIVRWFNEGGVIDKAISPAIRRAMREKNAFVSVEQMPSILDKSMKLQAFHARVTGGSVHFPVRRPWADHVIDQLIKFPAGKHDDGADVCGLLGRGIDQMMDAHIPVDTPRPLLVPFTEKWLTFNDKADKPKVRYF